MKIDETKLKIASVRAKDRHTRQAEVEDAKWHGINEARKADQLAAAHAGDAATAKAKMKASQDDARAAAEEAAKAAVERDGAIARATQAETDKRIAEEAAARADAGKRAAVAAAKRMHLEKASAAQAPALTSPGAASAPPTAALPALSKPTDEVAPSKRERQIQAIVATGQALGFDILSIPRLGKGQIRKQCLASLPELFGAGVDPFKEAWQEALDQDRVRTLNHNQYTRRK